MHDSDSRPNIVLVSIDSLRADHCGCLGDDRGLTPTLDRLAADGVTFQNAIATGPQTFSSMPAVFTGHHRPATTLQTNTDLPHWQRRLNSIDGHLDRYGTFPERLQDLGYTTAGFSPNPWMSSNSGTDRGFDHFSDLSGDPSESRLHRFVDRLPGKGTDRKPVEIALDLLTGQSFFARWEGFYDELLATVRDLPEPYFLWVFLMDTHFPFNTGRAHREEQSLLGMYASMFRAEGAMRGDVDHLSDRVEAGLERSYRDSIRAMDAFLDSIVTDLEEDDPVLFLHSDHGESFGDHGEYGHHHRRLYEENVHVPLVIANAGVSADVEGPTSLATLHDAVLETGHGRTIDPRAMAAPEVYTASECGRNRAVRSSRFKYVQSQDGELLFDLLRDPAETENVVDDRVEVKQELEKSLQTFITQQAELDNLGRAAARLSARNSL